MQEITIERCGIADRLYVDFVMRHPQIYPHISDDLSPKAGDFTSGPLLHNPNVVALKPRIGVDPAGVFIFHPWNGVTYEVHSCVLPQWRGRNAANAALYAALWIFGNTDARKIVTLVPAYNRRAYALAWRAGMRAEGVNKKSFLKDGKLHDAILMGLQKDDCMREHDGSAKWSAKSKVSDHKKTIGGGDECGTAEKKEEICRQRR